MTLQELFRNSDFETMFDYIVAFDPRMAVAKLNLMSAYEYLCDIEPVEGDDEVLVTQRQPDNEEQQEVYVWCRQLESESWNVAMGLHVVLSDETTDAPHDMVAGMCLWHLAFYGFSPEQQHRYFKECMEEDKEDGSTPVLKMERIRSMRKWTAIAGWEFFLVGVTLLALKGWMLSGQTMWNLPINVWSTTGVALLGVMALVVSHACHRHLQGRRSLHDIF